MLAGLAFAGARPAFAAEPKFTAWLAQLKREALARGISRETFDNATAGIEPIPRVLELDSAQPEFKLNYYEYIERVVSPARVKRGKELLAENAELLGRIAGQYDLPANYIVALWGVESDFGRLQGNYSVVGALATLAYAGRRAVYFRGELLNALRILDEGHISPDAMKGSWAGAMGQCQFMPSSFLRFAVDFDGDGKRDIWQSRPDALASIAHYMQKVGWKSGQGWGREVVLPEKFNRALIGERNRRPLAQWSKLGVIDGEGKALAAAGPPGAIVIAPGEGPTFLVHDNFRAIMAWNRSYLFAIAVGTLADRLAN
jgi:membrane-bound lytic murein transglycosylase B